MSLRNSFLFLVVAAALLIALVFASGSNPSQPAVETGRGDAPGTQSNPPPSGRLELVFAYGSEKRAWVEACTQRWLSGQPRSSDGQTITVRGLPMGSGECMEDVAAGRVQAHLVSPASDAYIRLGNARARAASGRDLVARTEPLVLSPVVLALWKPMAEALGWPAQPVGWRQIFELVNDPRGWASRGRPDWGRFRFGHTHPEYSNSGLQTLAATCFAGAGRTNELRLTDLAEPAVANFVAGIQRGVVHYGQSTGFFAERLVTGGPGYLSAAVLYESSVVEAAKTPRPGQPPLVCIYPTEGTFWSDHPAGVVDRPWVSAAHRSAAEAYLRYLLAPEQQRLALEHGFRPADPAIPVGTPIDAAHGADPRQPSTVLPSPDADVLAACLDLWRSHKKRAEVALVLDRSGSMRQDGRMAAAQQGAQQFLDLLHDADRFSYVPFNDSVAWAAEDASVGSQRAVLRQRIGDTLAQGGTALYDAIAAAHQRLAPRAEGANIAAIVVLTDGEDRNSRLSLDQLLAQIGGGVEGAPLRIFTICYGGEANASALERIAQATQARSYRGSTADIVRIFRDISTFF
jgi:Ca-activated chloride channel family protein